MATLTVSELCTLVTDGTHYTPPSVEEGIPFLSVKDMTDSGLNFKEASKISPEEYDLADKANASPKKGDVLFSKDGTVGKVHVVVEDTQFAVLSSIAILRPNTQLVSSRYLGHALRNPELISRANKNKTGSAIRRIILKDIKQLKIQVPEMENQDEIVEILDRIDHLKSSAMSEVALLDSLFRTYQHRSFN